MAAVYDFEALEQLLERGEFLVVSQALQSQLELRRVDADRYALLHCRVQHQLGHSAEVLRQLGPIVKRLTARELGGIAYATLARAAFAMGQIRVGEQYLHSARGSLREPKHLAEIELDYLSNIGGQPFEAVLGSLQHVRKLVVRTGNPHLSTALRLVIGRLEVVRRAPREAHRHFQVAAELLREFPNRHLEGRLLVSKSALNGMLGDLDQSYACAEQAAVCGRQSGDAWTQAAAAINMSHVLGWRGDFDAAERSVRVALSASGDNVHLRLNAQDSCINLYISAGRISEAEALLTAFRNAERGTPVARRPLYALSDLYSRARFYQAQRQWSQAIEQLDQGIELATDCGDRLWGTRMSLAKARCLSLDGRFEEAARTLTLGNTDGYDLEGLALYYSALAVIERSHPERVAVHIGRVFRLCDGMSNVTLKRDLVGTLNVEPSSSESRSNADLESAVALLDLAAHSHILGREAFALICRTACADGLALVAHGHDRIRIVDQLGWSDQQPPTAQELLDDTVSISIGGYRDEVWEVVARPRADVQSRCAFAAIRKLIAEARELVRFRAEERERSALWPVETVDGEGDGIWVSEESSQVLATARRIAPSPLTVLLTGETGTGKEVLARDIHRVSGRGDRIFLPFNCAAVPRDMLESQLFGYRKGAFTGAEASFPGVIRSAAGGTLFLDEIADVPLELQPKLLRFIETQEIHPLGEPQPIKVDVRIIAATNATLEQLVAEGRFRDDLFYRLSVVRLNLPPLRRRREEIPALVHHYLRKYGEEQKKGQLTLADETLEYLLLFPWPGNVRQLANEVRRMVALAEPDSVLAPAQLSPEIQASRRTIPAASAPVAEPELHLRLDQPLPVAVEMLEQAMIRSALQRSRGRVEEAAKLLGISRKGLFLKRRRWNLDQKQAS